MGRLAAPRNRELYELRLTEEDNTNLMSPWALRPPCLWAALFAARRFPCSAGTELWWG